MDENDLPDFYTRLLDYICGPPGLHREMTAIQKVREYVVILIVVVIVVIVVVISSSCNSRRQE